MVKQEYKGRNWGKALGVWGLVACVFFVGCNPGDPSASQVPSVPTTPEERTVVLSVQPPELTPGNTVEISGRGFPLSFDDIMVRFKSVQDQGSGIPGMPVRLTANLISVVVPTAVPTGLVTVSVRDTDRRIIKLAPKTVTGAPMLAGYYVPNAVRVPGVVEGNQFEMETPTLVVYGLNIDASVSSAELRVLSPDRQNIIQTANVTVNADGRGVAVPGISDSQIRGLSITLPQSIGSGFAAENVTYIEVLVRNGSLVSNVLQVPAINSDWALPGPYDVPMPALMSGCWVNPGVQGNLLEIFYTVFQPVVRFKWTPLLEAWDGTAWVQVPDTALLAPPKGTDLGTGDYQPSFIIAGDTNQKSYKSTFAGPGITYRLLLNVRALWQGTGQGRLRMQLASETQSHGEVASLSTPIVGRLIGNRHELPYFAVSNALTWPDDVQATISEEFMDKEMALDRDTYTGLDSSGVWSDENEAATGVTGPFATTGSGTASLDETILQTGFSYLFDTNTGQFYEFPSGASDTLIATVRSETTDPVLRGLTPKFVGQNPGASRGELHVSRLVVPANVKIYGRGKRVLVIRVSGAAGGLAAQVYGEIIVDGLNGTEGTWDSDSGIERAEPGKGGAAGPGGSKGGGGGVVRTRPVGSTIDVSEALSGESAEAGGGAGMTIAYTLPEDSAAGGTAQPKCFVYGGPGGGGGFGTAGGKGRPSNRTIGDNKNTTTGTPNPWVAYGEILRVVGTPGPARGAEDLLPLLAGAGGGGGGGWLGRATFGTGTSAITRIFGVGGGGGGGGGGAFQLVARGSVEIGGRLAARGGNGMPGRGKQLGAGTSAQYGEWAGACGGGGSGGAIFVQVTDSLIFKQGAELDVTGGLGGRPGTTTDPKVLGADGYPIGGDGGRGRIRLEAGRGVNLPSSVDLNGVMPSVGNDSPSTVGPILKNVDGGTGVHGALDLTAYPDAANSTFYIGIEEDDTPVVYYFDANSDRVDVVRQISGLGEFNFTSLFVPEGVTLKGVGLSALVIRVQGRAEVYGTIDVSGADGQPVEVIGNQLIPGGGGSGGPGGGDGGLGGIASRATTTTTTWETTVGEDGMLPSSISPSSGGGYLSGDPWNDPNPSGDVLPAEGGLTFSPELCVDQCGTITTHQGGGGGGGGFGAGGGKGAQLPGTLFDNGAGGLAYGSDWFLNDGTEPFFGGSGGGGGGASTSGATGTSGYAGSGGGGGGGCAVLAVLGDTRIGPSARIDATGGNAFKAASRGGNGGAGSGGAIFLRVNGNLTIESGAVITALGGQANQNPPTPYPAPYSAATVNTGGDGAVGRVRIEFPGGTMDPSSAVLVVMKPEGTIASVGTSFQGTEVVSWVWSKPMPLALGPGSGLMMTDSMVYATRVAATLLQSSFQSPIVRWAVLVDGGEAMCSSRAQPDRLFGPMIDFGGIGDVGYKPTYMRFLIAFVSSSQTAESAEVDRLEIPWEPIDYAPAPPPP